MLFGEFLQIKSKAVEPYLTKSPRTAFNHGKPLYMCVVGIYREIIIPRFLSWCRILYIHSMAGGKWPAIAISKPFARQVLVHFPIGAEMPSLRIDAEGSSNSPLRNQITNIGRLFTSTPRTTASSCVLKGHQKGQTYFDFSPPPPKNCFYLSTVQQKNSWGGGKNILLTLHAY